MISRSWPSLYGGYSKAFLGLDTLRFFGCARFWYFLLTQVPCPLYGTVGLLGDFEQHSPNLVSTVRVFWPIITTRVRFLFLRTRLLLYSPTERNRILFERVEALCPVGANPFDFTTVYRRWASAF